MKLHYTTLQYSRTAETECRELQFGNKNLINLKVPVLKYIPIAIESEGGMYECGIRKNQRINKLFY